MKDKMKYFKAGLAAVVLFPWIVLLCTLNRLDDFFGYSYKWHKEKISNISEIIRAKIWD